MDAPSAAEPPEPLHASPIDLAKPEAEPVPEAEPAPGPSGAPPPFAGAPPVDAAIAARRAAWSTVGRPDNGFIAHELNPMFIGGPAWPATRQAFQRVRRGPWTIIASDGLSDPAHDDSAGRHGAHVDNGLGIEVFAEADDPALTGDLSMVPTNWAMQLIWQAAQNVALNGAPMIEWLAEHGVGSIEFYDVIVPELFTGRDQAGKPVVGALLGVPAPGVPDQMSLPGGPVRLLSVTIITARELDYVRKAGPAGRQWLAGALAHAGTAHRSSLARPSLI